MFAVLYILLEGKRERRGRAMEGLDPQLFHNPLNDIHIPHTIYSLERYSFDDIHLTMLVLTYSFDHPHFDDIHITMLTPPYSYERCSSLIMFV